MTDILSDMTAFLRRAPSDVGLHVFLDRQIQADDVSARQLLYKRKEMMTDSDTSRASAYLVVGYFTELTNELRLVAWVLALEMEQMRREEMLRARFETYSENQMLFQALPALFRRSRNLELIPYQPNLRMRDDGVINWDGVFVRLDRYLPPTLVAKLIEAFPSDALYVRLEPDFAQTGRPQELLLEEVLVPADPSWWKTLHIHRGQTKGAHYFLQSQETPENDSQSFIEYRLRGVRSLEVHAKRPGDDYLSMMVEELVDLRQTSGFLLGRCIHWDTGASIGTTPEEARVKHLDLAINVYTGNAAEERLQASLSNGKVTSATFRTHLLRTEGIPAEALLSIAEQFFVSSLLIEDWFQDQFRTLRADPDPH